VDRDEDIEHEERAIYAIVLLAGAPIVIALLAQRRSIDGGNALVLILVALGALGLAAGMRQLRRPRLPRARVVRDDTAPHALSSRRR
jgi:hypothetical protein